MTDVVFIPPASSSPAGAKVEAGPFWPDIDLNAFRKAVRIGNSTIPDERLVPAIYGAVFTIESDLSDWKATQLQAGHTTLEACAPETIGGHNRLVLLFERAVFAYAAADLIETHPDVSATRDGADRAEALSQTPADHRRNGIQAIRDILGKRRTKVSLL